jgi:mRNA interferase MazF
MYKQGDIVLIPIPFTGLSSSKKRPVLILSSDSYNASADDLIVAAITSNIDNKPYNIVIKSDDLTDGNLLHTSCVRADKLYTLAQSIVIKKFGTIKEESLANVIEKLYNIVSFSKALIISPSKINSMGFPRSNSKIG